MGRLRLGAMAVALVACVWACAGRSPEPARPAGGTEPPASSTPPTSNTPPVSNTPPADGTPPGEKPSAKPVGTKLVQDAAESPKAFKLGANDASGHGLGKAKLTVDGR